MTHRSTTILVHRTLLCAGALVLAAGCFWGGDSSGKSHDRGIARVTPRGDGGNVPFTCGSWSGTCPEHSCDCGDGTRVSGAACADFGGDGCQDQEAYCSDACFEHDGWSAGPPSGAKRVFVTSTEYNGAMGGLAGADARCQTAANAAALGGTWRAWLSDSHTDAIDRIPDVGPWYDLKGRKVFNNRANLATSPLVPIAYDEQGNEVFGGWVWTGTASGGTRAANGDHQSCYEWTTDAWYDSMTGWEIGATAGAVGATDASWTAGASLVCSQPAHLYCFET